MTDNAVRKWCISYKLPAQKRLIDSFSDEDWENEVGWEELDFSEKRKKETLDHEKILETYLENYNLKRTAELCGCSTDTVHKICTDADIEIIHPSKLKKTPLMMLPEKMVFNDYENAIDYLIAQGAKAQRKCIKTNLRRAAMGKRKTAYNHEWKFIDPK